MHTSSPIVFEVVTEKRAELEEPCLGLFNNFFKVRGGLIVGLLLSGTETLSLKRYLKDRYDMAL